MRTLIFALCFAAALAAGLFNEIGLYFAAGMLAVLIAAAAENLADKGEVNVSYERVCINKGGSPVLIFAGKKRLRGRVLCENIVTGERTALDVDIRDERRYVLPAQDNCGGLLIRYTSFYRKDIPGITKRSVVCCAEGYVTVMPDPSAAEVYDMLEAAVGENEPDGAREARPDEPLRKVNLKLTHRFGKPYINTYIPERSDKLWLFADYGAGDRAGVLAEAMCGLAQVLSLHGVEYGLVLPYGEDDFRYTENADSETVMYEVLHFPMYKSVGVSFLEKLCSRADEGNIIAFAVNTDINDERITIIDGI